MDATSMCLCSETLLLSARIASDSHRSPFSAMFIPTATVMRETHRACPMKSPHYMEMIMHTPLKSSPGPKSLVLLQNTKCVN